MNADAISATGRAEAQTHGHWAQVGESSHFRQVYADPIGSIVAIRTMSGFYAFGGGFDLPRIDILPNDALLSQFLPRLMSALQLQASLPKEAQVRVPDLR